MGEGSPETRVVSPGWPGARCPWLPFVRTGSDVCLPLGDGLVLCTSPSSPLPMLLSSSLPEGEQLLKKEGKIHIFDTIAQALGERQKASVEMPASGRSLSLPLIPRPPCSHPRSPLGPRTRPPPETLCVWCHAEPWRVRHGEAMGLPGSKVSWCSRPVYSRHLRNPGRPREAGDSHVCIFPEPRALPCPLNSSHLAIQGLRAPSLHVAVGWAWRVGSV